MLTTYGRGTIGAAKHSVSTVLGTAAIGDHYSARTLTLARLLLRGVSHGIGTNGSREARAGARSTPINQIFVYRLNRGRHGYLTFRPRTALSIKGRME